MRQGFCRAADPGSGSRTQWQEERGNGLALPETARGVIVSAAVADDAPPGEILFVLCLREGELPDLPDEEGFLLRGEEVGLVGEARREHLTGCGKQHTLRHRTFMRALCRRTMGSRRAGRPVLSRG